MSETLERVAQIRTEAEDAIARAATSDELEQARIKYLGRKAELPNLLRAVAQLPPDERAQTGRTANEARQALDRAIDSRHADLATNELNRRLEQDRIDVTLPADPLPNLGGLHLLTQTRREIEEVFIGLGFDVAEGPEVETVFYNFTALNTPATHPSRQKTDTFYISDQVLLRTHTSPVQIRSMELHPPPLYIIVPGRVYRPDPTDATHAPQFHQIEGLAVDTDVTLGDLKGTLEVFARSVFGEEREIRLRPDFFPFTEPSVEVDVSCFNCTGGFLADGSRCPVCKGDVWIEILGAGMVDPNVFGFVRDNGYDSERIQGFAFGMGVERIAMLKYGVPDLRMFFDNDVRFLEQFG
ncbi:MAG TPA: phenylalanine--tRNA ligase subunit alpha [Solirubrobacteraceae bacterium]|jgi:phenylalanyl-tRNA synthetase alpha chain